MTKKEALKVRVGARIKLVREHPTYGMCGMEARRLGECATVIERLSQGAPLWRFIAKFDSGGELYVPHVMVERTTTGQ